MRTIMKKITPVLAFLASVLCLSAVGADLTVDSGAVETISGTATYGQVLVNGTLNVADGANITVTRLMCGTNGTGTAIFNLGKNAKLTVKGEDSNGLDCCFGYNTPCTAMLEEGSLITTMYAEVAYLGTGAATVTLSNATIRTSNYFYLCRSSTSSSVDPKVWTAQVYLKGEDACLCAGCFTRNQRASARILFDGGFAQSLGKTANWFSSNQTVSGATLACEGLNGNPVILEVSSTITALFGCANSSNAKVGVQGDCDLVIRGTFNGNLGSASYVDGQIFTYTGKTIVQSSGLKMNKVGELPAGTDLEIAGGTTVDLKGFTQTIASIKAEGTLKNTGTSANLILTSDTKASVISGQTVGNLGVAKEGAADLTIVTADGQAIDKLHVRKGAAKVCGRDRLGHRFYRFAPTARYGSSGTSVQYDELYLYDENGTDITGQRSGFTSGAADDGSVTRPQLALDGDTETKFYCAKAENAWIALEFAEARKLSAYTFATGDDYGPIHKYKGNPGKTEPKDYDPKTCRDVSGWRLECSDDGTTWWALDEVTDFVPEDTRMYAYPKFEIGMSSAVTAFDTIMIDEGATLTLDGTTASFVSLYRNGALNGINGAKIVTGAGTSIVYGDGAFSGTIDVGGGTLRFGDTGAVGPWFRLSITGNRTNAYNSVQLSELALYDAQGNRVNGNLAFNAKDKSATSLAAGEMTAIYGSKGGSEAPDKLTDGNLSTKGGLYTNVKPNPITMRLAESFASSKVFSYALASANDHAERDPASWTLEASTDGTNWTVLDTRVLETVGDIRNSWLAYNGGLPYFTTNFTAGATAFSPSATVKIGGGATLDLSCAASTVIGDLVVDCATGGSIRRFVPAAAGTLTITGAPASWQELTLPLAVTDVGSAANLEGWTVTANGRVLRGASVFVKDGFLCVRKSGLVIVVK